MHTYRDDENGGNERHKNYFKVTTILIVSTQVSHSRIAHFKCCSNATLLIYKTNNVYFISYRLSSPLINKISNDTCR